MKTANVTFSLHPQSTIITPQSNGIAALRRGVDTKMSIYATPQTDPIILQAGDPQWLMVATAGTSGTPKIIRRKPETWIASFDITRTTHGISSTDTYATFGALGHSLTLFATLEALHLGADICALDRFKPRAQAQMIADHNITVLYATPTQLRLLTATGTSFPSVTHIFVGGGRFEQNLHNMAQTQCPNAQIFEFFGASETSFITMSDANTPANSVGRPYPGVDLKIDDTGEIWVKSPYLFDSYTDGTSPDTRWQDGYLSIGEMGYRDQNGCLFLKGRKNRMVTVADQNVFPEKIEHTIAQIENVQNCAVIATPDAIRGHRLICFFASSAPLQADSIRAQCRTVLAPHEIPKEFIALAEIPLLSAGKPDLSKLRAMMDKTE